MRRHKFFISGASGFIGRSLLRLLNKNGDSVIGIGRSPKVENGYVQCDIFDDVNLKKLMSGCTCIVHCAGYAHDFKATSREFKKLTWRLNYESSISLMDNAVDAGVDTFIYLSSVKSMGNSYVDCIDETWPCNPEGEYGKSKLAAENYILKAGLRSGIRVIVLRLAMVYGSGGRGNLERMSYYVWLNLFPPLPETSNRRSMVHLSDVLSAIICVSNDLKYASGVYIVTGLDSPSGRQLYNNLRLMHGKKPISFSIPLGLLVFIAEVFSIFQYIFGHNLPFNKEVLFKLLNSECYSSKKLMAIGSWRPKVTLQNGLKELNSNGSIGAALAKRIFDIFFSLGLILLLIIPMILIGILIKLDSPGPIIYWSKRVGLQNKIFSMPKFRSMQVNTPVVATNLILNPAEYLTRVGKYIRRYSLDEIPQLWSILAGEMSFVGPRPALYNQCDLVDERVKFGIHQIRPGLTGWAQINGRDNLKLDQKVFYDKQYIQRKSFKFDLQIIFLTLLKVFLSNDVSH